MSGPVDDPRDGSGEGPPGLETKRARVPAAERWPAGPPAWGGRRPRP